MCPREDHLQSVLTAPDMRRAFLEVNSAQNQATNKERNLEDFLILAGVVRAHDRSPPLQQSCTPGCAVVTASGGGGNVSVYQPLPERMACGTNHQKFCMVRSSASSVFPKFDKNGNAADMCNGQFEKVAARKQPSMIRNSESAARSRARRQAHKCDLEAELQVIKEENARLQHALYRDGLPKNASNGKVVNARMKTAGHLACPHCAEDHDSYNLSYGGKPTLFDNHRKKLSLLDDESY
ncbi:protein ABSCISIC ACID-INSENSITIVE 5-like [Apium graveolens]|uniref:protein ABSCISIC ACID-INSENSITIVE 5-like n=1 Tax=Apium graveolens TaxID=4045 RepID=UPI003D7BA005